MTEKSARTLTGTVVSDKMQNAAVVLVERRVKHPVYGKIMTVSKKYHVSDPNNEAHTGDTVQIAECRPVSKTISVFRGKSRGAKAPLFHFRFM